MMWLIYQIVLLGLCCQEINSKYNTPYVVLGQGGSVDIFNSPNQLQNPSQVETVVIPGSLGLDNTTNSTIPNRFTCPGYTMLFLVPDPVNTPRTVRLQIVLPGSVSLQDKLKCDVNWMDGNVEVADINVQPFYVYHTYAFVDVYYVNMECKDKENKTSHCPLSNHECITTHDFLDNKYADFKSPLKFLTTDDVLIRSYMELRPGDCGPPSINWLVTRINGSEFSAICDFKQPNTSILSLKAGYLEPGEYIVSLEVLFLDKGPGYWSEDRIIIRVFLPELVTYIKGGELLDVPHGGDIFIDATLSWDPAGSLASVAELPLEATWKFAHYKTVDLNILRRSLMKYHAKIPQDGISYQVRKGVDYVLKINTRKFEVGTHAAVMFEMRRGDRNSTAMQMIRFLKNAIPVSITCVFNCHVGRERLLYYDKVELDLTIPQYIDRSQLTFNWTIKFWYIDDYNNLKHVSDTRVKTYTGLSSSSIGIRRSLRQGHEYRIYAVVSGPKPYSNTKVELIRTVNTLPYDGGCRLESSIVTSARDWLTLACTGWRGNDNRNTINAANDINPILTYTVRQFTRGALVEEEPIFQTRSERSHIILKVGDVEDGFKTTLFIEVADMFKNVKRQTLIVQSNPAFDTSKVTPDAAGAAELQKYTNVDYPFDETQLRQMGKNNMIVSLISAVCSNLHLIVLPIWEPPVPRVLNADGSILDMSEDGNKDVGNLGVVYGDANNETINPATLAIQEVLHNMTVLLKDVVNNEILSKNKSVDKMLTSIITNAFTNLAARPEFTDLETKRNLIFLGEVVGMDALGFPNTTEDVAAQLEISSGEIYFMFQAIVAAAVPDELRQIKPVGNLLSGRKQIDDMMAIIGKTMNISDSLISPLERAFLFLKMQRKLRWQTDKKKLTAKEAVKMALNLSKKIQEKLKLCADCSNEDSNKTHQLVANMKGKKLDNFRTQSSYINLNDTEAEADPEDKVSISAFEMTENAFMYDNDGMSSLVTSNVLRIDAKTPKKRFTPGFVTFEQDVVTPEADTITPHVDEEDASEFMYHEFIYQSPTDNVCLIVLPIGEHNFTSYTIYFKFDGPPTLIDYHLRFDIEHENDWQTCILPEEMKGHNGTTYLAVALPSTMKENKYNLTIVTVACMTWEEAATKWHSDKCDLEWHPNLDKIVCFCRELSEMVLANSFYVAPNTIDFSTVFLKFSPLNQAAVMATLIIIFTIYLIAVIFLRRLDRRDTIKWSITPLRDNMVSHSNYYIIKVFTGMRRHAGTRSRIAFILTGNASESRAREMFDGVREEFATGSVMTFFMATKTHLGELEHMYIWHDNSAGPWYLNQIIVYDIKTQTAYTFVAERWLSIDTSIDAQLPSSPRDQPIQFETRFFHQTKNRISESHMWVSIMYRPQFSTFTRVQRASCALVYICLTMIANAMYFNPNPEYESRPILQVGPLRFTSEQIFISIVCALMTTPAVMLLIFLFKRTRSKKHSTTSKSCCCGPCCCLFCNLCRCFCCRCRRKSKVQTDLDNEFQAKLLTKDAVLYEGFYLPHCFVYFAWLLVFAGIITPAFFIMLYSMDWGKQKSEEWLSTLLMSLLESMFCVDPIMVICISFVLACLIRTNKTELNVNIDTLIRNYKNIMGGDDASMDSSMKILKSIKDEYVLFENDPIKITPPLQGRDLAKAAEKYRQQVKLFSIVKDIAYNIFFMFVVFSICYSNRDDRSYMHTEQMMNNIVSPYKLPDFTKIKTPGDLYTWLNVSVIPHLFPEFALNGVPLHWSMKQFRTGYDDLRLGPPRLRQLRTKNGTCYVPYIGEVKCYGEYKLLDDEEDNYCIGWKPKPCPSTESVFNFSTEAWTYKNAIDIWGMPIPGFYTTYGGGGYVCPFDVSRNISINILNELFHNLWMDRQTRAVIFEFTLYNGATNIFIYNSFLVEFPQTGGAFTSYTVYPIRVYNHHGPIGSFTLICEVIFVIYLICLMVKICIRIYQQRCGYFKQFWQNYELVMFIIAATAIVVFAIRFGLTFLTIEKFKEDKKLFVNFNHIVFWDQILVTILGVLAFMTTLRILEIFATSKKVDAVVRVFEDCGKDLFWYGVAFLFIFLGFCFCGFLLFGSRLLAYMNLYRCMGTLFIALIGKSQFTEINETQPILAKIFFTAYIFIVVFFVMTIFLSILGASIDKSIQDTGARKNEDLMELLMKRLISFIKGPSSVRPKSQYSQTPPRTRQGNNTPGSSQGSQTTINSQGSQTSRPKSNFTMTSSDKLSLAFYKMRNPFKPSSIQDYNDFKADNNGEGANKNKPFKRRQIVGSS